MADKKDKVLEYRAVLLSKTLKTYEGSSYTNYEFLCEDGYRSLGSRDVDLDEELVSSFDDIADGRGKVGLLVLSTNLYKGKTTNSLKSFERE